MYNESIHTNNLSVGYGKRVVRSGINLSIMAGEMVCLLGRNGSGKSTLLRTLAGLQPALGGELSIGDVAIVLTERLSVDNTTVRDIVSLGRYPYLGPLGVLRDEDHRIVKDAMHKVGISEAEEKAFFNAMSDGEKQRVLIAKAIAQTTPIILLDEPTAHLDLPNRIAVLQLLQALARDEQKTIIISTHELDLAMRFADRILLFADDEIIIDTPDKMRQTGAIKKAFGIE